nr:reverse transcriptase domain-containing protein [Tanacetum cinerariifolium]
METRGRKKSVAKPAPPARDPRDLETIKRLQQRIQELEFQQGNPLLTKKTKSEPIIWNVGDEKEEYPFVNKYQSLKEEHIMFVEDESCPVYDIGNEKDVEPAPKYDFNGDDLVYEDEEVCLHDVGESLVIQRVLNVAPSKFIDDDSWCWNNIFCPKCTSKGKVCNMIIDEGSCENVVSTYMVEKLALKIVDHPEQYQLIWRKKGNVVKVSKRCFLHFSSGKNIKKGI